MRHFCFLGAARRAEKCDEVTDEVSVFVVWSLRGAAEEGRQHRNDFFVLQLRRDE